MIVLSLRIVYQQFTFVLEYDSTFILRYIIFNELNGLEGELAEHFINEVGELLGIVIPDKEDMLNLFNFGQTPNMMIDNRFPSDCKLIRMRLLITWKERARY